MTDEALPGPIAGILKAADRPNLIAAPVILDHAFGDAVDVSWIIVEIANERPDGFHGVVEDGAVMGCDHLFASGWAQNFTWVRPRPDDTRFLLENRKQR
jgi:hypothetical protein